jgi:hypothetical protein
LATGTGCTVRAAGSWRAGDPALLRDVPLRGLRQGDGPPVRELVHDQVLPVDLRPPRPPGRDPHPPLPRVPEPEVTADVEPADDLHDPVERYLDAVLRRHGVPADYAWYEAKEMAAEVRRLIELEAGRGEPS